MSSIRAGLRPILQQTLEIGNTPERTIFLFRNGQIRRQIGEGHSHVERLQRRLARRERRRAVKAGRQSL